jgi:hypothetical protein
VSKKPCATTRRQQVTCPPDATKAPRVCESFEACVGNFTLAYDGECMTVTPRADPIPDGTWGLMTFVDGCIVRVDPAPVPSYTPDDCCAPASSDINPPAAVMVSPDPCNLTSLTPAGLLTLLSVRQGAGVKITGCGTTTDPLTISAVAQSGASIAAKAGDAPIRVEGDGSSTSALIIGMNPSGVTAGSYLGFSVNKFGLVTGFTADGGDPVVRSITGTTGISALQVTGAPGVYEVKLDNTGVEAATYRVGRYDMVVNAQGQIKAMTEVRPAMTPGTFYTPADPATLGDRPKRVSYDANGAITAIEVL